MDPLMSTKRLAVASPATPVLLVSLVGFEPGRRARIASMLADCTTLGARWRVAPDTHADLWLAEGNALLLDAGECPTAFAEPLHPDVEARFRFDPDAPASLAAMLAAMAPWLAPKVAQQALVAHLVANGGRTTRTTVIHVQDHGRLVAVMDFAGETGVATDVTPAMVQRADWHSRPAGMAFMPSVFHRAPTEEVLWRFATRAHDGSTLPSRYLRLPVYLRRVPTLAPHELTAAHNAIVDEITNQGRTLRELQSRLALDGEALVRDLAALHLIGAITCDPMRALATGERRLRLNLATDCGWPAATSAVARHVPTAAH
jgi:hypothetical protein